MKLYYAYDASLPVAATESRTLRGYAAVYNRTSSDRGGYKDVFAPTIFSKSLPSQDVRALVNHDSTLVLGRTSAGTLRLATDANGLSYELDVAPTSYGDDQLALVRRGDISGMSIGISFYSRNTTFSKAPDGQRIRTIHEATPYEISLLGDPAFPETTVRNYNKAFEEQLATEELEEEVHRLSIKLARVRHLNASFGQ